MTPSSSSSGPATALPKYLPGLDGIRALAALIVLLCHALSAATIWSPAWTADFGGTQTASLAAVFNFSLGAGGVGLFFVLSGLCIHLPVARAMANGVPPSVPLGAYFKRRFRRIYPPHVVALVGSIGVAAVLPLASLGVHDMVSTVTWQQLLAHLALIHTFVPDAIYSGNHVLWSIAVEAHFYLLFPLVLLARRRVRIGPLCVALLVAAVGLRLGGRFVLDEPWKSILAQSFLCRMWEWTLGCWIAERLVSRQPARAIGIWEFAGLLSGTLVLGMALVLLPYGQLLRAVIWPPLFAVLIYRAATMKLSENGLFASIGKASYSLYLVHPIALSVAVYSLRKLGFAAPWQEIAVGMGAAALLTWAFHRWVERPFMSPAAAPAALPVLRGERA